MDTTTNPTATRTTRFTYRHSEKHEAAACTRKAVSIAYGYEIVKTTEFRFLGGNRMEMPVSKVRWNNPWNLKPTHIIECPDCGKLMGGRQVEGTYSEGRKCDDRCLGAVGPDCECQCGGTNHGSAHSA